MTGKRASREAAGPDRMLLRHEILEAERALYRAQVAGSVDELRPMVGANLVYIHSTGVAETRDEYLAASPVNSTNTARSQAATRACSSSTTWRSSLASST
jgi:hypothetical protein